MEGRLRASCQGTGQLCLARAPGCTSLSSLQESWERLLASSRYNEQESFAVVFQPFFYETALSPLLVGEVTVAHRHPSPPTQLGLPEPRVCALGETLWCSLILPHAFPWGRRAPCGRFLEAERPSGQERGLEPGGCWLCDGLAWASCWCSLCLGSSSMKSGPLLVVLPSRAMVTLHE